MVSAEAVSVDSRPHTPSPDDELDPAALQKAFKFAAWSSIILVSRDLCAAAESPLSPGFSETNNQILVMNDISCTHRSQLDFHHCYPTSPRIASGLLYFAKHVYRIRLDRSRVKKRE